MQSSTLSQSQLQTEIKTHAQNAVDTLWQFESITNFHLLKLHRIQSLLQDILLEKTGISSHPTRAQDIARALEDCQHLQGELFEQSYNSTSTKHSTACKAQTFPPKAHTAINTSPSPQGQGFLHLSHLYNLLI